MMPRFMKFISTLITIILILYVSSITTTNTFTNNNNIFVSAQLVQQGPSTSNPISSSSDIVSCACSKYYCFAVTNATAPGSAGSTIIAFKNDLLDRKYLTSSTMDDRRVLKIRMVPGAPAEMGLFMILYDLKDSRGTMSYLRLMRFEEAGDISGKRFIDVGSSLGTVPYSFGGRVSFDLVFVARTRVLILTKNTILSNVLVYDVNMTMTRDSDGTPTSYSLPSSMGPVMSINNVGSDLRAVVVDPIMDSITSSNTDKNSNTAAAEFFIVATQGTKPGRLQYMIKKSESGSFVPAGDPYDIPNNIASGYGTRLASFTIASAVCTPQPNDRPPVLRSLFIAGHTKSDCGSSSWCFMIIKLGFSTAAADAPTFFAEQVLLPNSPLLNTDPKTTIYYLFDQTPIFIDKLSQHLIVPFSRELNAGELPQTREQLMDQTRTVLARFFLSNLTLDDRSPAPTSEINSTILKTVTWLDSEEKQVLFVAASPDPLLETSSTPETLTNIRSSMYYFSDLSQAAAAPASWMPGVFPYEKTSNITYPMPSSRIFHDMVCKGGGTNLERCFVTTRVNGNSFQLLEFRNGAFYNEADPYGNSDGAYGNRLCFSPDENFLILSYKESTGSGRIKLDVYDVTTGDNAFQDMANPVIAGEDIPNSDTWTSPKLKSFAFGTNSMLYILIQKSDGRVMVAAQFFIGSSNIQIMNVQSEAQSETGEFFVLGDVFSSSDPLNENSVQVMFLATTTSSLATVSMGVPQGDGPPNVASAAKFSFTQVHPDVFAFRWRSLHHVSAMILRKRTPAANFSKQTSYLYVVGYDDQRSGTVRCPYDTCFLVVKIRLENTGLGQLSGEIESVAFLSDKNNPYFSIIPKDASSSPSNFATEEVTLMDQLGESLIIPTSAHPQYSNRPIVSSRILQISLLTDPPSIVSISKNLSSTPTTSSEFAKVAACVWLNSSTKNEFLVLEAATSSSTNNHFFWFSRGFSSGRSLWPEEIVKYQLPTTPTTTSTSTAPPPPPTIEYIDFAPPPSDSRVIGQVLLWQMDFARNRELLFVVGHYNTGSYTSVLEVYSIAPTADSLSNNNNNEEYNSNITFLNSTLADVGLFPIGVETYGSSLAVVSHEGSEFIAVGSRTPDKLQARFSLFRYEYYTSDANNNNNNNNKIHVSLQRADNAQYEQVSGVGVPMQALVLPRNSPHFAEGDIFWLLGDTKPTNAQEKWGAIYRSKVVPDTTTRNSFKLNFTVKFHFETDGANGAGALDPIAFISDPQGNFLYITRNNGVRLFKLRINNPETSLSPFEFSADSLVIGQGSYGPVSGPFGLAMMTPGAKLGTDENNKIFISSLVNQEGTTTTLRYNASPVESSPNFAWDPVSEGFSASGSASSAIAFDEGTGNLLVSPKINSGHKLYWINGETLGEISETVLSPANLFVQLNVALLNPDTRRVYITGRKQVPTDSSRYNGGISEWQLPERTKPTTTSTTLTTATSTVTSLTTTTVTNATTTSTTQVEEETSTTNSSSTENPSTSNSSETTQNPSSSSSTLSSTTITTNSNSPSTSTTFTSFTDETSSTTGANETNSTIATTETTSNFTNFTTSSTLPPLPTTRIKSPVEEANIGVGSTTSVIAGISANPAAATSAFKALSMALLASCGNLTLRENPLSFDSNPFGFDFPLMPSSDEEVLKARRDENGEIVDESGLGTYLGAVVGNLIPLFGVCVILIFGGILLKICGGENNNDDNNNSTDHSSSNDEDSAAAFLNKKNNKKQKNNKNNSKKEQERSSDKNKNNKSSSSLSMNDIIEKLRAPGVISPVWILFGPPSCKAVAAILSSEYKTTREIGFAIPAMIFYVLIPVMFGIYIFIHVKKHEVLIEYEDDNNNNIGSSDEKITSNISRNMNGNYVEDNDDDDDLMLLPKSKNTAQPHQDGLCCTSPLRYLLLPSAEWEDSSFVQKYGLAFDCYKNSWFFLFDYVIASAVGIVTGASLLCGSETCCHGSGITVLVMCLAHTFAILFVRPFVTRFDTIINILLSSSVSVAAGLAVASNFGSEVSDLLNGFTTAELVLCLIDAVFTLLPLLFEMVVWMKEKCLGGQATKKVKRRGGGRGWGAAFADDNRPRKVKKNAKSQHQHHHLSEITSGEDFIGDDEHGEEELHEIAVSANKNSRKESSRHPSSSSPSTSKPRESGNTGTSRKSKSSASSNSKPASASDDRRRHSSSASSSSKNNKKAGTTIEEAHEILGLSSSSRSRNRPPSSSSSKPRTNPSTSLTATSSDKKKKNSSSSTYPLSATATTDRHSHHSREGEGRNRNKTHNDNLDPKKHREDRGKNYEYNRTSTNNDTNNKDRTSSDRRHHHDHQSNNNNSREKDRSSNHHNERRRSSNHHNNENKDLYQSSSPSLSSARRHDDDSSRRTSTSRRRRDDDDDEEEYKNSNKKRNSSSSSNPRHHHQSARASSQHHHPRTRQ